LSKQERKDEYREAVSNQTGVFHHSQRIVRKEKLKIVLGLCGRLLFLFVWFKINSALEFSLHLSLLFCIILLSMKTYSKLTCSPRPISPPKNVQGATS
jgi:hypothetical protein